MALLIAVPAWGQTPVEIEQGLALKQQADTLKMMHSIFVQVSTEFDEGIQERNAPFNAAAAAKYCAEYTLRALVSPKMRREFRGVAANLAYDTVAEAADAAELMAEMTALTNDVAMG